MNALVSIYDIDIFIYIICVCIAASDFTHCKAPASCDFLTENRRNIALGIIGLIRKANNRGVVDVPVTGFFSIPLSYLSLSFSLSQISGGSVAQQKSG